MDRAFVVSILFIPIPNMRYSRLLAPDAAPSIDGFTLQGAAPVYPPDLSLEPRALLFEAHVDLANERMDAAATYTIVARRDGALTLRLDAVSFEELSVEGSIPLDWQYDGKVLVISPEGEVRKGDEFDATIRYSVVSPAAGLYFSQPTAEYPENAWFAATDNETERARHWLPCVDAPSVRVTLEYRLRCESRFTVIANGAHIINEPHDDDTWTSIWKLDHPCPAYLSCFAIGQFVEVQAETVDDIPIRYYATGEFTAEALQRTFAPTPDMLRWLQTRLGVKYPYPKYYQFAVRGIGGAMENISLVSWDDRFILDAETSEEWQHLIDQINVHEMAHMWFGDMVVCRDYTHAWLKESWATYIEQVWYHETRSVEEGDYENYLALQMYRQEADNSYVRPLVVRSFNSSWQMYDRHLYPGGAVRLEMLRRIVGDDPFWSATRIYLETFAHKVAETDDFRRIMEAESGLSLGRFFDQWIHSPGYPKFKVEFTYDKNAAEGRWVFTQTQVDKTSGVGLFDVQTDIAWVEAGELKVRNISLSDERSEFSVRMETAPEQVRVNAISRTVATFDFNPGDDCLRRQVTGAPDVQARILAGEALAKTGTRVNLMAVKDSAFSEVFWGVRVQHVVSLADIPHQVARDCLRAIIDEESDPRALPEMLRAAVSIRDHRLAEVVLGKLKDGLRPRAAGVALELLGNQRYNAPMKLLVSEALADDSVVWRFIGAMNGLSNSRRRRSVTQLEELVVEGKLPVRVRPAAIRALGRIIPSIEREARRRAVQEKLLDLLTDADVRVRMSAALAICDANTGWARGTLEAFMETVPNQDAVSIRQAMQSGFKASSNNVSKDVDALRDRVGKLERQLSQLLAQNKKRESQE
jgi:aminopeptidase N